jgi:lipopolysaccharide assembly protein A
VPDDAQQEPAVGGDPTRSAPGLGSGVEDPATMAVTEPPTSVPRKTNAGRMWISLAVATVLLVLLIIFIAENSRSVTISFLGVHGHISLALALLIAAVVGVVVTLLAGTARILQLRWEVRRTRRSNGDGGPSLQPH